MADPWNTATPTNANTVKDTVPDEFQALKVINTTRLCTVAAGMNATSTTAVSYGPFWIAALVPNWTIVDTFDGTLAAGGSTFTFTRLGYYRVTVTMPPLLPFSTTGQTSLSVVSHGSGGDITEMDNYWLRPSGGATDVRNLNMTGVLKLGAGRTGLTVKTAAVAGSDFGTISIPSGYSADTAMLSIEFMRPL